MADNRLVRKIARQNGARLLDAAIDTLMPVDLEQLPAKKKTLLGGIAGAVAVRVATRSVPGAIVVGGAMIAKRLYDRRHAASKPKASEKGKPKA
ncbi:hypothetical protein [Novosphingobium sp.]|uniref:hypothetical protein n=1 Tax=Novosphingobium sp. TaxID=1874826 RepID=UPI0025E46A75|nr:hypothetical protein [Novosphingobium sp.]MCC6926603.1 hypothetical protein [Novosphingobium sp.]